MQYVYLGAISLVLMGLFIYFEHQEKYIQAVILKGAASFCFVVLGYVSWQIGGATHYGKLIFIGLILGFVADILLNLRFVFEKNGQKIFIAGILTFLSGHVLYICALANMCGPVLICGAAAAVLTALILKWIFSKITAPKAIKIFGIFYIGAVVLMTCFAFGALITEPSKRAVMFFIGALLFLISDVVLILNTFGKETKFSLRITNLTLYYLGQILIALSLQLV